MYMMLSTGMGLLIKLWNLILRFQVRPKESSVVCWDSKRASCSVKTITEEHACMCTFALIWSFKLSSTTGLLQESILHEEWGKGGEGELSGFSK